MEPASLITPPPASTLVARLANIFVSPGEVFEEVKASEPAMSNWLAPVLFFALVGVVSAFVIFSQPAMMQQIREQQAKVFDQQVNAGKMTRAQADQAMAMAEKFSGPTMMKITGSVGAVVSSFTGVFWRALILWLLGMLVLKARFDYLKALEVAGLATMISVLGAVVTMLLTVIFGKATAPSLALLVGHFDPKNPVHLLAAAVNVFTFWQLGVMAAGLARLATSSFARALSALLVVWLGLQAALILLSVTAAHFVTMAK
jgi:hypothetical protein